MNKTIRINDEFKEFDTRNIDDKKRLTLGELAANYDRVRLYSNKKGEILIMPVAEIPVSELWLYEDKVSFTKVVKGLKEAKDNQVSELDINEL
jgi:hypothetical protein